MSISKKLISIVIATYNRADSLGKSICSVLEQTYKTIEIIIIDDGSEDNTEEVVRNIKDPRIRYYRFNRNEGAATARNEGINMAKGEYIAFQDSDDEWLPDKLEKQLKVFEADIKTLGAVYSDMQRIRKNGNTEYWASPTVTEGSIINKNELEFKVRNIGIQSALIKKECFNKVGRFDERLPRLIDMDLFVT